MDGKSKESLDEFKLKKDIYLERAYAYLIVGYVENRKPKIAYETFVKEK